MYCMCFVFSTRTASDQCDVLYVFCVQYQDSQRSVWCTVCVLCSVPGQPEISVVYCMCLVFSTRTARHQCGVQYQDSQRSVLCNVCVFCSVPGKPKFHVNVEKERSLTVKWDRVECSDLLGVPSDYKVTWSDGIGNTVVIPAFSIETVPDT